MNPLFECSEYRNNILSVLWKICNFTFPPPVQNIEFRLLSCFFAQFLFNGKSRSCRRALFWNKTCNFEFLCWNEFFVLFCGFYWRWISTPSLSGNSKIKKWCDFKADITRKNFCRSLPPTTILLGLTLSTSSFITAMLQWYVPKTSHEKCLDF